MICQWFELKTTGMVFSGLTSKPMATVFSGLASKPVAQVSSLGLKTGSSGSMIWASKSPRRFLSLGLKIKHVSVCWLHHKTDGGRKARGTC
jgi:hypothetical protein